MNKAFLEKFKKAKILVVGEVGIDEYIWGDSRRISPEAPVPIIEVESVSEKLGLAANVAQNITSLGAQASLVSICGQDLDSDRVRQMLLKAGVEEPHLFQDPSRPTLRKVRVVAQKQHVVRVDYEKVHPMDSSMAKAFEEKIVSLLPFHDGVVLQDYGKGLWNADTVGWIRKANELAKPVFVDPSRSTRLGLYQGCTLLTPNIAEAELLCGVPHGNKLMGKDDEKLFPLAKKLLEETRSEHSIITCGEWGMVALSKNESTLKRFPTFAREVFDVTGAGDTVISVIALMMTAGYDLVNSIQVANAAAGIVVGKIGTATVTPSELTASLENLHSLGLVSEL